jgi:hypothetical protein
MLVDKDLDPAELGGMIEWTQPLGVTPERVVLYRAYLSEDAIGQGRLQIVHDVLDGTNKLLMPAETQLASFVDIVVYTQSSLVEQTTPASFTILDRESRASNITFPDHDLDFDDIGGLLFWIEPDDISQVTHYVAYLAEAANGTNRSYFDNSTVGVPNITVPVDNQLSPYTHWVIYTLTSLVEQTTPSSHEIFDGYASVYGIGFTDKDLDPAELGGKIEWFAPNM